MVERVMTREQFYAQYPNFAAMGWNDPQRQTWLANHPGAAAQWSAIRDVEQKMTQTYGDNWRNTAGEQWTRVVSDYLDGGFGNQSNVPAAPAGAAPAPGGGAQAPTDPVADAAKAATQASARAIIEGTLAEYGLQGLGEWAWNAYLNGTPTSQILLDLKKRPEYKTRFSGMAELAAKGRAISETEYISLERSYAQQMRAYGLPASYYDGPEDFADLIGGEVSAQEWGERLEMRSQVVSASPKAAEMRRELAEKYGIGEAAGLTLAYWIDPDKGADLIKRQFHAAEASALANLSGFGTLTTGEAERIGDAGYSEQYLSERFGALSQMDELATAGIGDAGDRGLTRDDLLKGGVEGDADAAKRLERQGRRRVAAFDGGGGYAASDRGVSGLGSASG